MSHYLTTKSPSHQETPSFLNILPLCLCGEKPTRSHGNHETQYMEHCRRGSTCPERSRRKKSPPVFGRFFITDHHDSNQNQIDWVLAVNAGGSIVRLKDDPKMNNIEGSFPSNRSTPRAVIDPSKDHNSCGCSSADRPSAQHPEGRPLTCLKWWSVR